MAGDYTEEELIEKFIKFDRKCGQLRSLYQSLSMSHKNKKKECAKVLEEYEEVSKVLVPIQKELDKKARVYAETFYFVKCNCGARQLGADYDRPSKEFTCSSCGKTSILDDPIERRSQY